MLRKMAIAVAASAAVIATAGGAAAANAGTNTISASTSVTNRDDSGINGDNWALDTFTRTARITYREQVAGSNCGGNSPCYYYTGHIYDKGSFTTLLGQLSPGAGDLNGGSEPTIGAQVTGPMRGNLGFEFYTTAPLSQASASNVPADVSGDTPTTGQWVEQFFPSGTPFWDTSGNTGGNEYLGTSGGWTYTAHLGSDSACPNVAGRWIDASASGWGSEAISGNIVAPDAEHC